MTQTSFAFAGSADVDPANVAALLNDLMPHDEADGTPGVGAVFVPERVPNQWTGLKAAVAWLEGELGKRAVHSVPNLIESLVERVKVGNKVTFVIAWPDEPTDAETFEVEQALVLEAREHGIPVLNLAAANNDLLWEPEPETPEDDELEPVVDAVATSLPGGLTDELWAHLRAALEAVIVDVLIRHTPSAPAPAPARAKANVATPEEDARAAAKLSGKARTSRTPAKAAATASTEIDEPPFDPPHKPASTVFRHAPDSGGSTDTEERFKYYVVTAEGDERYGRYRPGRTRMRRTEEPVMLTQEQIEDLVKRGLMDEK